MAKYRRDKILENNGGRAPEPGHRNHKLYCMLYKHCEGHFKSTPVQL